MILRLLQLLFVNAEFEYGMSKNRPVEQVEVVLLCITRLVKSQAVK